jgi:hypothetical protein
LGRKRTVLATRQVGTVDLKPADIPQEAVDKLPLMVEWSGFLTPTETGEFNLGVRVEGTLGRLSVDDKPVAQQFSFGGLEFAQRSDAFILQGSESVDQNQLRANKARFNPGAVDPGKI